MRVTRPLVPASIVALACLALSCKPETAAPERVPTAPEPAATTSAPPPENSHAAVDDRCTDPASCQAGCDRDLPRCCNQLGLDLQDGRGMPKDPRAAQATYRKSCTLGLGVGCFNAGLQLQYGSGIPANAEAANEMYRKARRNYRRACDKNELEWCVNLGVMYEQGRGQDPDPVKAASIYGDACTRGNHNGCLNLAAMRRDGRGGAKDHAKANTLLQNSCDAGHLPSCNNLANFVRDSSKGDPLLLGKAASLYKKVCDESPKGGIACRNLGYMMASGAGTAKNVAKAFGLFEKACAMHDGGGCMLAGGAFESGDGTARNLQEAVRRYGAACDLGYASGCKAIAAMAGEKRVQKTPAEVHELLKRACRLHDREACEVLNIAKQP